MNQLKRLQKDISALIKRVKAVGIGSDKLCQEAGIHQTTLWRANKGGKDTWKTTFYDLEDAVIRFEKWYNDKD